MASASKSSKFQIRTEMAFQRHNIFRHNRLFLLSILSVLPALLLGLDVENDDSDPRGNRAQFQCLASVGKCLSSCAWQIPESQETSCQQSSTNMQQTLWKAYGNLTERLEQLAVPHPDILQKLQDLHVKLQSCRNEPQNNVLMGLSEGVKELKKGLETLAVAQRNRDQLELTEKQLSECKESLQNSRSEANRLRRLVRERYNEGDLVKAAATNDLDKLRALLEAGFKVDSRDKNSYSNTPLHGAAYGGNLEIISFLVEKGAPLEAKNSDGNTPFIDATIGRHIPAAQLLVNLGANPTAKGNHGSARDRAARDKNWELVEWLKQKGW